MGSTYNVHDRHEAVAATVSFMRYQHTHSYLNNTTETVGKNERYQHLVAAFDPNRICFTIH